MTFDTEAPGSTWVAQWVKWKRTSRGPSRKYYNTARKLASEAKNAEADFTDKEKINLETYAERQNDEPMRPQISGIGSAGNQ